ncbi:hypothetical protein [Neobacillus ginsengisoli]|uniref:Uncharacterized protein n=1 Tax=Neobacillus ginsengisoli TaxID=904295 RepID=A0ABT9XVM2_9BACI|nr:hypothetical protein [Neobacillus ginsengisoli]MDQ0199305.1 hypothetical protein [Neobacillus ginsengisoli]
MEKISIGILILAIVGGLTWIKVHDQVSKESVNKSVSPVVQNIKGEPITGNGTLGQAIHNTHIFLNGVLKKGKVKTIDFTKNKGNLDTVVLYEDGAVNLAKKLNASKEIIDSLQKDLIDTKTAIANQDYKGLYKVEQSLLHLEQSYNIK